MSKISDIKEAISKLQKELRDEQSKCSHTQVIYENTSSTGNYDPNDDSYTNHVTCIDCGKTMMFDSEKESLDYRLKGIIGSELQINKEDYKKFLQIKSQLGSVSIK